MKKLIFLIISLSSFNLFSNDFLVEDSVYQGSPLTFVINNSNGNIDYTFSLYNSKGTKIQQTEGFNYYLFENKSTIVLGLSGIPVDLPPGIYRVKADGKGSYNSYFFEKDITVKELIYPSSILNGNSAMDSIVNGKIDQERLDQSKKLWDSFMTFSEYILYHEGVLSQPVKGRHSSPFGYKRVTKYPKGKDSITIHYGEDLAVPIGTPVLSCGNGRVLLAENRIVTGNSVVIEHLPGVVSIYYHMDKLNVKRGDLVLTGDIIGEAGTTGYSTGPHVHWELRFSSIPVDPMIFLTRPLIDKVLILNMINSTK